MNETSLRVTVARQLAALRRQGWSAADAVAFVVPALDPGPLREACARAAARLRNGEGPGGDDLLEALISRGDAAGPVALDTLAESYVAGEAAGRALRYATWLLTICLVGPILLGCLVGWSGFDRLIAANFGRDLPATGKAVLSLVGLLKWGGPPLALLIVWVLRRGTTRVTSQGREAMSGGALLQLACALESGQTEAEAMQLLAPQALTRTLKDVVRISAAEARFLDWARGGVGLAQGARALAAEKLRTAALQQARFERLAPVVALVVLIVLIGGGWATLALTLSPVFALAGAI